jgi:hypothetical protein
MQTGDFMAGESRNWVFSGFECRKCIKCHPFARWMARKTRHETSEAMILRLFPASAVLFRP